MKPSVYLLNSARGRVVDEPALADALARRQIGGAALDVMVEGPLPAASPLWAMEHVLITPHAAGEKRPRYSERSTRSSDLVPRITSFPGTTFGLTLMPILHSSALG